jgi:hypothetical protein
MGAHGSPPHPAAATGNRTQGSLRPLAPHPASAPRTSAPTRSPTLTCRRTLSPSHSRNFSIPREGLRFTSRRPSCVQTKAFVQKRKRDRQAPPAATVSTAGSVLPTSQRSGIGRRMRQPPPRAATDAASAADAHNATSTARPRNASLQPQPMRAGREDAAEHTKKGVTMHRDSLSIHS